MTPLLSQTTKEISEVVASGQTVTRLVTRWHVYMRAQDELVGGQSPRTRLRDVLEERKNRGYAPIERLPLAICVRALDDNFNDPFGDRAGNIAHLAMVLRGAGLEEEFIPELTGMPPRKETT